MCWALARIRPMRSKAGFRAGLLAALVGLVGLVGLTGPASALTVFACEPEWAALSKTRTTLMPAQG